MPAAAAILANPFGVADFSIASCLNVFGSVALNGITAFYFASATSLLADVFPTP